MGTFFNAGMQVVDRAGNALSGRQFQVWTGPTGTRVYSITDMAGGALPGYVTSDDDGLVPFKETTNTWSTLYYKGPDGKFTPVNSIESLAAAAAVPAGFSVVLTQLATNTAAANTATTVSAGANARSLDAISRAQHALDTSPEAIVLNVMLYGAVGDGVQDDTDAIQDAMDAIAPTGGVLLFPRGKSFQIKGFVELCSNVTIDFRGATLQKRGPGITPEFMFVSRSHGASGYGSGVQNVRFRGGTIWGDFANDNGISFTLHHAAHIEADGITFRETMIGSHNFDMGGCEDVHIHDCVWQGFKTVSGHEYAEAIQCDYSSRVGMSQVDAENSSYDGTPTRNVRVDHCQFLPLTISGVTYPAPNPIGQHGMMSDHVSDILFEHNLVVDGRVTTGYTGFDSEVRGWIHFVAARGVRILNNTFRLSTARSADACTVIQAKARTSGTSAANAAEYPYVGGTLPALPATTWAIEGNRFEGFKSTNITQPMIELTGNASLYTVGIQIQRNKCRDGAATIGSNAVGKVFVFGTYVSLLDVSFNTVDQVREFIEISNGRTITVAQNQVGMSGWSPAKFVSVVNLIIYRNQLDGVGAGFYIDTCTRVSVTHNQFDTSASATGYGFWIGLTGCTTFTIADNQIQGNAAVDYGIRVYGTSVRGKVNDNIVLGTFNSAATIVTGNTNVTESGTVAA